MSLQGPPLGGCLPPLCCPQGLKWGPTLLVSRTWCHLGTPGGEGHQCQLPQPTRAPAEPDGLLGGGQGPGRGRGQGSEGGVLASRAHPCGCTATPQPGFRVRAGPRHLCSGGAPRGGPGPSQAPSLRQGPGSTSKWRQYGQESRSPRPKLGILSEPLGGVQLQSPIRVPADWPTLHPPHTPGGRSVAPLTQPGPLWNGCFRGRQLALGSCPVLVSVTPGPLLRVGDSHLHTRTCRQGPSRFDKMSHLLGERPCR